MNYLYNLKENYFLNLYFAIKDRKYANDMSKSEKLLAIDKIVSDLDLDFFSKFEVIIIPESSSTFIEEIVKGMNINYYILKKNSKEFILNNLKEIGFSRQELESQINRINKMENEFKLNKIKSNQRDKYIKYLFKDIEIDISGDVLFLDDSCFTGTTLKAVKEKINIKDSFFIFKEE